MNAYRMLFSQMKMMCMMLTTVGVMLVQVQAGYASSHRKAPFITENPKVDGTDFYMFRSYEDGREAFVTLVANYLPLQDPYGGPNYFFLDEEAIYDIHIDNDGDARADITFRFDFNNILKELKIPVGDEMVPVPLYNIGQIMPGNSDPLNIRERYKVSVITQDDENDNDDNDNNGNGNGGGDDDGGEGSAIVNAANGSDTFTKPADNVGNKSIPDYAAYAAQYLYHIDLPGNGENGRMFVGQRKDPFVVNLGETFDLVNLNPLGPVDAEKDDLADKNVTSLILEIPISFLTQGDEPVIGGWTTASLRKVRSLRNNPSFDRPETESGPFRQVSRLGMPLVNEVVIGLPDKNRFNASKPEDDGQFLLYVSNPTLPTLLNILFGDAAEAPCLPRNDLVNVFLKGVAGLNRPQNVTPSEMLRLNTSIDPTPAGSQSNLGVLGGDVAGFPNGRRPGDDVVDITLRAAMGVLRSVACAPDGQSPFTDGAVVDDSFFDAEFPYIKNPIPGSPNEANP